MDAAVAAARRSFEEKRLTPYERYEILLRASELIIERGELLADTIVAEAGFPYVDAENEVRRAAQTFIVSAEEGKRLVGEVVPIEAAPATRTGWRSRSGFRAAWSAASLRSTRR